MFVHNAFVYTHTHYSYFLFYYKIYIYDDDVIRVHTDFFLWYIMLHSTLAGFSSTNILIFT